jgi:hypothetical protein
MINVKYFDKTSLVTALIFFSVSLMNCSCTHRTVEKYYYANGKLFEKGYAYDNHRDSVWDTFDSVTGLIIDISRFKDGLKTDSVPRECLLLSNFDTSCLKFSIQIPIKWEIYIHKKTQLIAVQPTKYPDDSFPTYIFIRDTNLVVPDIKQQMDRIINVMPHDKSILLKKIVSRASILIDGNKAEELIWTNYNLDAAYITTLVQVGNIFYTITCTVPNKRLFLYLDLFREIINSMHFKNNVQNTNIRYGSPINRPSFVYNKRITI